MSELPICFALTRRSVPLTVTVATFEFALEAEKVSGEICVICEMETRLGTLIALGEV